MLFRTNRHASMTTIHGLKSPARTPRVARVAVEPLEGRRLMDAGGSAGLNLTAQADVHIAVSEQVNAAATFNTLRGRIDAGEQSMLATVHASEQTLANLAAKETLMLQQSTKVGASAAVAVHAKVLAQVNAELARVKATEGLVVKASVSAQAQLQARATATLGLVNQAAVTARQEVTAAAKGLSQTAAYLHASVAREVVAAEQSRVSAQASVGASVQGISGFATTVSQQVTQDVAAAQQLEATLQASGSGVVSIGPIGLSTTSTHRFS